MPIIRLDTKLLKTCCIFTSTCLVSLLKRKIGLLNDMANLTFCAKELNKLLNRTALLLSKDYIGGALPMSLCSSTAIYTTISLKIATPVRLGFFQRKVKHLFTP